MSEMCLFYRDFVKKITVHIREVCIGRSLVIISSIAWSCMESLVQQYRTFLLIKLTKLEGEWEQQSGPNKLLWGVTAHQFLALVSLHHLSLSSPQPEKTSQEIKGVYETIA
jgi:hypothetical protein